ncbi:YgdI/YgdR family lipoprotein [Vibrio alginolyticus]|uniref:YgdI/YgdR family lipoprotein n=1 Tax=Vibrio alginolyticus TaxID=663 RepID=UPI0010BD2A6C|nr:YgdI/YgdR family lipoprotein [Vibrio alginolyticus]MCR9335704.1 YgdI/YgdR family lipoprotein [Vibrio alginolyticus]MCR9344277.1 YgdI/YgdR family lipoprotein [Vibrio alginolyticus]MCR9397806.1 YgdI/YgdR family lipoprotein [Vibrio alginolyticus]MCZ6398171.1 YgdI/YgdR family lipoprotein [Vibrio alginolyticus]TKF04244.1 YgdI/YgdR family lipoprotein [Vibrio alginolyticus]
MRVLTVIATVLLLAACGSSQYLMSTNEGKIITSYGKPDLNEETGMYEYEDMNGKEMSISKEQIVQIVER